MAKSSPNKPMIVASLPEDTAHAARAVFNIENVYLAIGDRLDNLLEGIPLFDLDTGKAFHPDTLIQFALLTIFQFAEDLSDRSACAALVDRMDWKYALHLPIRHPRLAPGLLCRFRQPLIGRPAVLQTFQALLDRFGAVGLLSRSKREVPAGSVVEHLCRLNKLDRFHEDMCQAIEVLACHQAEMLRNLAQPHWYHRYREDKESRARFATQQQAYAQALGSDACHLLQAVARTGDAPTKDLREVRHLAAVWEQQYQLQGATVVWRDTSCETCPWLAEESRCHHRRTDVNSLSDSSEEES